jgi:hypothetical protein
MNQQSSIVTGGIGLSAASLVPLISWALDGFAKPVPATVPYVIAALLVAGGHLGVNLYRAKFGDKSTSPSPASKT